MFSIKNLLDLEDKEEVVYNITPQKTSSSKDLLNNSDDINSIDIDDNDQDKSSSVPILYTNVQPSNIENKMRNFPKKSIIFTKIKKGDKEVLTPSIEHGDDRDNLMKQSIEEHKNEYMSKATYANRLASFLKMSKIIIDLVIIVIGIVVGVLSMYSCDGSLISSKISSALGFTISAITTIKTLFALEKRSVVLKQASIQLRTLSNDLAFLNLKDMSVDKKMRMLAMIEDRADETKMNIFDMDVTSFKPPEHRSIVSFENSSSHNSKSESSSLKKKMEKFFRKDKREASITPSNIQDEGEGVRADDSSDFGKPGDKEEV